MKVRYSAGAPAHDELDRLAGSALVELGTNWCSHCQAVRPLLAEVFGDHSETGHLKIKDGPGRRPGRSFRVKLRPTLIFLRGSQEVVQAVRPGSTSMLEETFESLAGED